jgi:hypothetical protein
VSEYHKKLEAAGHKLIRDDDGYIDIFVLDEGYHNGPGCELCGESWCHHCEPTITPCTPTPEGGG